MGCPYELGVGVNNRDDLDAGEHAEVGGVGAPRVPAGAEDGALHHRREPVGLVGVAGVGGGCCGGLRYPGAEGA